LTARKRSPARRLAVGLFLVEVLVLLLMRAWPTVRKKDFAISFDLWVVIFGVAIEVLSLLTVGGPGVENILGVFWPLRPGEEEEDQQQTFASLSLEVCCLLVFFILFSKDSE